METKVNTSNMNNRVDNVAVHNNSEKINYLDTLPPCALQLGLVLSQGYLLSTYDAHRMSLVSHFFRELFFSYALKPHNNQDLPVKEDSQKWTPQEKFEQLPLQCIKEEFLPFSPAASKELAKLELDSILIKHVLARKERTVPYLLDYYRMIKGYYEMDSIETRGIDQRLFIHYQLAGLIPECDMSAHPEEIYTSLSLKAIQRALIDREMLLINWGTNPYLRDMCST